MTNEQKLRASLQGGDWCTHRWNLFSQMKHKTEFHKEAFFPFPKKSHKKTFFQQKWDSVEALHLFFFNWLMPATFTNSDQLSSRSLSFSVSSLLIDFFAIFLVRGKIHSVRHLFWKNFALWKNEVLVRQLKKTAKSIFTLGCFVNFWHKCLGRHHFLFGQQPSTKKRTQKKFVKNFLFALHLRFLFLNIWYRGWSVAHVNSTSGEKGRKFDLLLSSPEQEVILNFHIASRGKDQKKEVCRCYFQTQ